MENKKTKFIIIEGLDGTGKSMFTEEIIRELRIFGYSVDSFHNSASDERTIQWYKKLFTEQQKQGFDYFIWDRSFIGPFVWPYFFEGQEFTITKPSDIKQLFEEFDITVILPTDLREYEYEIISSRRLGEYTKDFKKVQKLFDATSKLLVPDEKLIMFDGLLDNSPLLRQKLINKILHINKGDKNGKQN